MTMLILVFSLIATVCLAAEKSNPYITDCNVSSSEVDGLRTMLMNNHPELLTPFLVSCNGWNRDLAIAFSLGLALGKKCDRTKYTNSIADADTMEEAYEMIDWNYIQPGGKRAKVVIKNVERALSVNWKWKDGNQTYNPFSELFDIKEIQNPENFKNVDKPDRLRRLFAKFAKNAIAMIAIDVAILKWMVYAIRIKSDECHMIEIGESTFMPLCALSMIPNVGDHCTEDILIVLSEVQLYTDPVHPSRFDVEYLTPSILTLFKLLEDGPIRAKVMEILTLMLPLGREPFLPTRMLLGDDHPFLRETFSDEDCSSKQSDLKLQDECQRKVYSIGNTCINSYSNSAFIKIYTHTNLSALVEQNNTLKWEGTNPRLGDDIRFSNQPTPPPRQVRLFIISQLPIPDIFWKAITNCTSMQLFQELMTKVAIRQMILSYGITILESSSTYDFHPTQVQ